MLLETIGTFKLRDVKDLVSEVLSYGDQEVIQMAWYMYMIRTVART